MPSVADACCAFRVVASRDGAYPIQAIARDGLNLSAAPALRQQPDNLPLTARYPILCASVVLLAFCRATVRFQFDRSHSLSISQDSVEDVVTERLINKWHDQRALGCLFGTNMLDLLRNFGG
jgi:hypothetical protein